MSTCSSHWSISCVCVCVSPRLLRLHVANKPIFTVIYSVQHLNRHLFGHNVSTITCDSLIHTRNVCINYDFGASNLQQSRREASYVCGSKEKQENTRITNWWWRNIAVNIHWWHNGVFVCVFVTAWRRSPLLLSVGHKNKLINIMHIMMTIAWISYSVISLN